MKKIGISTVHTGFNYGSCLQAYASQTFIADMGYDTCLVCYKQSLVKGRDIRVKKLVGIGLRTIWRPQLFKKTFLTYKNSLKKEIDNETKEYFLKFQEDKLDVKRYSWRELKKFANDINTLACVCGSDQIWNATNIYIDPIFYLRFAPKYKRVAYAPSFGKNFIPNYNKKTIRKYISEFNYISVREEKGTEIIKDLLDREVISVLDPTLMLNKQQWLDVIDMKMNLPKKYILLYFLDKPTEAAIDYISKITEKFNLSIISIPYKYDVYSKFKNLEYKNAGPEQFIQLISDASFVCTDSFHGMIFSINFNIPFYIFQRNYGTAVDQSSRIVSILYKLDLKDRFISDIYNSKELMLDNMKINIDFKKANNLLEIERKKSIQYLKDAFLQIENYKR